MKIFKQKLRVHTRGNPDFLDITPHLQQILRCSQMKEGILTVFVVGSTAALLTFEYEPGLIKDIAQFFDKLIPPDKHYLHDETWGDANGYSHLRAAFSKPSLTIPFEENRLLLGTWQQVVLAEFDNRPRDRELIVQLLGQ